MAPGADAVGLIHGQSHTGCPASSTSSSSRRVASARSPLRERGRADRQGPLASIWRAGGGGRGLLVSTAAVAMVKAAGIPRRRNWPPWSCIAPTRARSPATSPWAHQGRQHGETERLAPPVGSTASSSRPPAGPTTTAAGPPKVHSSRTGVLEDGARGCCLRNWSRSGIPVPPLITQILWCVATVATPRI